MIVTRQYTYGWTTSPKPAAVAVTVGEGWWWWEREAADEVQVSQSSNFFWMSLADVHRVGSVIQSNWRFNRVQLLGRGENLRSLIRQRASQHISWPSANFFCVELKCIGQLFFRWPLNDQIVSGRNRILFLIRRSQVYQSEVYLWGDKRFLGSNGGIWEEEIRRRRMKDKIGNKLVQVEFLWNKTTLRWNDWPGATNCVPNWTE